MRSMNILKVESVVMLPVIFKKLFELDAFYLISLVQNKKMFEQKNCVAWISM